MNPAGRQGRIQTTGCRSRNQGDWWESNPRYGDHNPTPWPLGYSHHMTVHPGGVEPPSAGYQPTALPLSYRWGEPPGSRTQNPRVNGPVLCQLSLRPESGRQDLLPECCSAQARKHSPPAEPQARGHLQPPAPKAGVLPGCTTSRGGDGGNRTHICGFSVRRLDHVGHISISRVSKECFSDETRVVTTTRYSVINEPLQSAPKRRTGSGTRTRTLVCGARTRCLRLLDHPGKMVFSWAWRASNPQLPG